MNSATRSLALLVTAAAIGGCTLFEEQPVSAPSRPAAVPPAAKAATPKPTRRKGDERPETYRVQAGDTLYGIALDFGLDYRDLAKWNGLPDPGRILSGQTLRLTPPPAEAEAVAVKAMPARPDAAAEPLGTHAAPAPVPAPPATAVVEGKSLPVLTEPLAVTTAYSPAAWERAGGKPVAPAVPAAPDTSKPAASAPKPEREAKPAAKPAERDAADNDETLPWAWPANGDVVYRFGESGRPKGVGIAGKAGQAVLAAADGKVVYRGAGLRGYGKLLIVKHNETYLSVYAHNQALLAKEGDLVRRGQKIAEMGDSDAVRVALHFEIRRFGVPVDPLVKLGSR